MENRPFKRRSSRSRFGEHFKPSVRDVVTTSLAAVVTEFRGGFKVNCISTEFTAKKHGGEKGVPFRMQIETHLTNDKETRVHAAACQIKVFKLKGADRKHKQDREKVLRRPRSDLDKYQPGCEATVLTTHAGEKKEGSESVKPAHYIVRSLFKAAKFLQEALHLKSFSPLTAGERRPTPAAVLGHDHVAPLLPGDVEAFSDEIVRITKTDMDFQLLKAHDFTRKYGKMFDKITCILRTDIALQFIVENNFISTGKLYTLYCSG
ncbi:Transcription factor CP2-like protein 1 [Eumeta japonica]|uniref:Transcription factor CP2-like protein 1 n=1 Tax=Eumeta variegata TaxID=151549 RepID=A0A4C1W2R8_EUMVA|nr:Transcription factor CP2-like protein 1 [Eumeta japonica]